MEHRFVLALGPFRQNIIIRNLVLCSRVLICGNRSAVWRNKKRFHSKGVVVLSKWSNRHRSIRPAFSLFPVRQSAIVLDLCRGFSFVLMEQTFSIPSEAGPRCICVIIGLSRVAQTVIDSQSERKQTSCLYLCSS